MEDKAAALSRLTIAGRVHNSCLAAMYSNSTLGAIDVHLALAELDRSVEMVHRGDLGEPEALLLGQAVALNAIFADLAVRAERNLGSHLDAAERYLRLALRAQAQSRATLETLAAIKNPPTVFAGQANIAHGPQQVNNHFPRAREDNPGPIEVLDAELLEEYGERVDTEAPRAAVAGNLDLAPVATRNRSEDA